ncbi:hypothetical protein cand_016680 [Cryptosporidium andersoni]|uniref:Uncharacterized protein n=1 Tax=Cryptosporidium andersoni TaxID=117008 RepID=A0A1J4MWS4_9CRYT|nr:hypothetical protein cand_016680 [Cryptosporidium andersoni]
MSNFPILLAAESPDLSSIMGTLASEQGSISMSSPSVLHLDYSAESSALEHEYSVVPSTNVLFNMYSIESTLPYIISCGKWCPKFGISSKHFSKKFNNYTRLILKEYIMKSNIYSWFYRLWSGSSVLTSPVLKLNSPREFLHIYELSKKYHQKSKFISVIILVKISTKPISKTDIVDDEDQDSQINSEDDIIKQSVKQLCSKLRNMKRSSMKRYKKKSDRFQNKSYEMEENSLDKDESLKYLDLPQISNDKFSHLYVIEGNGVTSKSVMVRMLARLTTTSCWNNVPTDKAHILFPIVIDDMPVPKSRGLIGEVFERENISKYHKEKHRPLGLMALDSLRKDKMKRIKEDKSFIQTEENSTDSKFEESNEEIVEEESLVDNNLNIDLKNSLFIRWIKICSDSKTLYEKLEKEEKGVFINITQKLLQSSSIDFVKKIASHNFFSFFPQDCDSSWNSLINLLNTENLFSRFSSNKNLNSEFIVNTVIDTVNVINTIIFKDINKDGKDDEDSKNDKDSKEKNDNTSSDILGTESALESIYPSELFSILSADLPATRLDLAKVMDSILMILEELPDSRKSRIEFRDKLARLNLSDKENTRYINGEIYQLFEAVDHVNMVFHLIRTLIVADNVQELPINPLEILVIVCNNAKLVPKAEYIKNKEFKISERSDNCNPLLYLSEDLLREDVDHDIMEPLQKSAIKYVSLLLKLSQYNINTANIHIANLVAKTERLLVQSIPMEQKKAYISLRLGEKIRVLPFITLVNVSYLPEINYSRISSLLNAYIPIFPTYTLTGLYGDLVFPKSPSAIARQLGMQICLSFYNPTEELDPVFIDLCKATWNESLDLSDYLKKAKLYCSKLVRSIDENEEPNYSTDKFMGSTSPQLVFLLCEYSTKITDGFQQNLDNLRSLSKSYIPPELDIKAQNILQYCRNQNPLLAQIIQNLYPVKK